jgi:hypothetical protein
LGHIISGVGELRLAKKALSGYARWKLKKARARASEAGTGGIQQPANAGAPKQGETLNRPRSEGSTSTQTARAPKMPMDSKGPRAYKEAVINIKIAIFRETYPEDKLTEDDQNSILEVMGKVLRRTPTGELPHLKSYRLERGAFIYAPTNSQVNSLSKLLTTTGWNRARLKATDTRKLPKPAKVALRIRDRVVQNHEELLKWIKNLNTGHDTEHWRVLKQTEPKGLRLVLFIDRDSYTSIKRIFTGLSQGTVKVLRDPEAPNQQETVPDTESSKSISEGKGGDTPTPSDDSSRADQGTTLSGTQSENREEIK